MNIAFHKLLRTLPEAVFPCAAIRLLTPLIWGLSFILLHGYTVAVADTHSMVGISGGPVTLHFTDNYRDPSAFRHDTELGSLRAGAEHSRHRIVAALTSGRFDIQHQEGRSRGNIVLIDIQGDLLLPIVDGLKIFAGGNLGLAGTRLEEYDNPDARLENNAAHSFGGSFGAQAGLLIHVASRLQLEAGAKRVRLSGHGYQLRSGLFDPGQFRMESFDSVYLALNLMY